jgi:putative DNA primase/helicase
MTQTIDLEVDGRRILQHLKGHWRKGGGMCRCPAHPDHDPSLSVRVGRKTLLFKCFAGCDAVDVIRAINHLRILDRDHIPTAAVAADEAPDPSAQWRHDRALEIWDAARPIVGTPAQRCLQERGLPGDNPELRYLARTPIGTDHGLRYRPAFIAAIRDRHGFAAIQRNFLDIARHTKAFDLGKAKMGLGAPGRGAVRLFPVTTVLGIAEGIETAWSASMLFGIPVWAVLGNERFAMVDIPAEVTNLVLLPDPGLAGERAEELAFEAHNRPGLAIETHWPRGGDWNDVWLRRLKVYA